MKTNVFPGTFLSEVGTEYPLKWLDRLITISLNALSTTAQVLGKEEVKTILIRLHEEDMRLQLLIKSQVFALITESEIQLLVRRYHSSLILLMDLILEQQKSLKKPYPLTAELYAATTDCLNSLLSFLETWFSKELGLNERVTSTYLAITKDELLRKQNKLISRIPPELQEKRTIKLIVRKLNQFLKAEKYCFKVTFRAVFYIKELIGKLEEINWDAGTSETCAAVNELLLYMNFNSKAYVKLLTGEILKAVNELAGIPAQLDKLNYHQKVYCHVHPKPGIVLNPRYHSLRAILTNWFNKEIMYLQKKLELPSVISAEAAPEAEPSATSTFKDRVTCILSTDQIGLILRGADEARVILAKSMNMVFKTIVPYLSTPVKEELSYSAMRSKVYTVEDRDKDIAINALEKIIKKIKDY